MADPLQANEELGQDRGQRRAGGVLPATLADDVPETLAGGDAGDGEGPATDGAADGSASKGKKPGDGAVDADFEVVN